MNLRFTTALLAFLFATLRFAFADTLFVGEFSIPWQDGWERLPGSEPIRYVGPEGLRLTVDLIDHTQRPGYSAETSRKAWRRYAKTELPKLATRHGAITIPLKSHTQPDSSELIVIGFDSVERGKFGLIFLHISLRGRAAQFALEGPGRSKDKFGLFFEFWKSAGWQSENSPNKSLQPTATPVMPPAAQEIMPGVAVAEH